MIKPPQKAEKPFSLAQKDVPERIAKRIARAGICSRREAEALILAGRVKLNGKMLDTAACLVTAKDQIEVDDKRVQTAEPARLWRYISQKVSSSLTGTRKAETQSLIICQTVCHA